MQRFSRLFAILILSIYSSTLLAGQQGQASTPGGLSPWQQTTNLTTARSNLGTVTYNNVVYAIGGYGNNNTSLSSIEYATMNPDGTVGNWKETTPLPNPILQAGVLAYNGYIYVAGGTNSLNGSTTKTTFYAPIKADGELGQWQSTSTMNDSRRTFNLAAYDDYLYAAGGYNGQYTGVIGSVEYAKINDDGSISPWQKTTSLPSAAWGSGLMAVHKKLYAIGGYTSSGASASVNYASIKPDGTLSNWNGAQNLPQDLWGMGAAANGLNIYALGGANNGGADGSPIAPKNSQQVYVSQIDPKSGSIHQWYTTSPIVSPSNHIGSITHNGYVYAVGGTTAGSSQQPSNVVQYAKIIGPQSHIPQPPLLSKLAFRYSDTWKATFNVTVNPRYSLITEYGFELTKTGETTPTKIYSYINVGYDDNNEHIIRSSAADIAVDSTDIPYGDGTIYKVSAYVIANGEKYRSTTPINFADISPVAVKYISKESGQLNYQFLFNSARITSTSIQSAKLLCDSPINDKVINNFNEGIKVNVEGVEYYGANNSFPYSNPANTKNISCDARVTLNTGSIINTDGLTDMEFTLP